MPQNRVSDPTSLQRDKRKLSTHPGLYHSVRKGSTICGLSKPASNCGNKVKVRFRGPQCFRHIYSTSPAGAPGPQARLRSCGVVVDVIWSSSNAVKHVTLIQYYTQPE
ncbi:hypothetical protein J6590_066776 [Homalodisca vitripennis]|nr:hypothetical protein J6590_066776 [Homalodisca vitripennis]